MLLYFDKQNLDRDSQRESISKVFTTVYNPFREPLCSADSSEGNFSSQVRRSRLAGCPRGATLFLFLPLPVAIACYALSIMEACHNIWNLKWQRDSKGIKGRASSQDPWG